MPDLHVENPVFCHAQDLLMLYDDDPRLVHEEELADVVRALLTHPVWSCSDDPTITTIDRHQHDPREQSLGSARRRAHQPLP